MARFNEIDDSRRRMLVRYLSAGWLLPQSFAALAASVFGGGPGKLPESQSIYRIQGSVTVNDAPATLKTRISPGDTVKTAADSELVFVVGGNSMILRANSHMVIEGTKEASSMLITALRFITGKALSVSRNRPMNVSTSVATIGIRGTGFYLEAEPERTYFCTCYGVTEVSATQDPDSKEVITAKQHDRPVYILAGEGRGKNIRNAPFINHTDQELALIEALVGRTPPFVFPKDSYTAPRRNY